MKHFVRNYSESILIALALIFVGALIWSFTWGVGEVVGEVDRAVDAKGIGAANTNFDLQDAANLDLHGLVKPSN